MDVVAESPSDRAAVHEALRAAFGDDGGKVVSPGTSPGTVHGFSRPSVRIPEPAFQVTVLPAHEPWMWGALVYCEPFRTCDAVGLRDRP